MILGTKREVAKVKRILRWWSGILLFIINYDACVLFIISNVCFTHYHLQWLSGYLEDKIFSTSYGASRAGTVIVAFKLSWNSKPFYNFSLKVDSKKWFSPFNRACKYKNIIKKLGSLLFRTRNHI